VAHTAVQEVCKALPFPSIFNPPLLPQLTHHPVHFTVDETPFNNNLATEDILSYRTYYL
jgi:hypothetical protein